MYNKINLRIDFYGGPVQSIHLKFTQKEKVDDCYFLLDINLLTLL